MIQKLVIPNEERELNSLKKRIDKNKKIIEKVERYFK